MKTVKNFILIIFISVQASAAGQSSSREQTLIKNFLTYISTTNWHIDTITTKYVVFYKEESKVASRAKRKFYLSMAVSELAKQVKNIKLDELKIIPYNEADEKLQIMTLDADFRERSYVVTDPTGKFVRYFLVTNDQIESFVLFQDKAYLLLN